MKVVINILIVSVLTFSCDRGRDKSGKVLDTPTTGSMTISADESLLPLVQAEVETFNGLYSRANIEVHYLPEAQAIEELIKDSVRMAIVSRRLTAEERKIFKDRNASVVEVDVAISGVALIVNKENKDTLISIGQIASLLQGKISKWSDLGSRRNDGIEIVFDNPNSGMLRQLKDSIAKVEKLPANCFAVENNQAVVDHVSKNVNAIGFVGLEWISDKDDSTATGFLKRVSVMGVKDDSIHFQPYQAYIALKHYPLTRMVTIINNASRTGLNAGFSRFFQSEPGQRIVLKAGFVPKTMPLRIVQYK